MEKEFLINQEAHKATLTRDGDDLTIRLGDKSLTGRLISKTKDSLIIEVNGKRHHIQAAPPFFSIGKRTLQVASARDSKKKKGAGTGSDEMSSPMPGKVLKVLVNEGDSVELGQGLVVMEAMKMEHTIKAAYPGVVEKVFYNEGDLVDGGVDLVELKKDEAQGEES